MPDKLTDSEIINIKLDLENHINFSKRAGSEYSTIIITKLENALDLINRQNAEIERLYGDIMTYKLRWARATVKLDTAKAEAYKECIEKVNSEIHQALESNYKVRAERIEKHNVGETDEFISYCEGKIDCLRGLDDFLDNLLKELVGE